jgi:biotin carboxyl carrier protein
MAKATDVKALLEQMKAEPHTLVEVLAPHTGLVRLAVAPGGRVLGPSGTHLEHPGTVLATLERERNKKPVSAPLDGEVALVNAEAEGAFVQAGTHLATIRHRLTREEVIARILKSALHLMRAPERAKYYFVPEVDTKIKAGGAKCVRVREGMELFIVSRMKRETTLAYSGPEGIVHTVYFGPDGSVEAGEPLIGVCTEEEVPRIRDVIARVNAEWEEEDR